ncbi:MAG: MerR family transcriptional regulator [Acidimicrobiales bacterium]
MHQIGEVVEAVQLSLRTIRHYDEVGLVPPSGRSRGGFRLYTDDDIERLRLVKHMKPLGFTLEEMRDLLEVRDRLAEGMTDESERDRAMGRLSMYAALARERVERLQEELRIANDFVDALRREAGRPKRARS